MIDIKRIIDLAEAHGFEVFTNSDEPGFFKKTQEGNVKMGFKQLIKICSSETIGVPDLSINSWEGKGTGEIVLRHGRQIKTDQELNNIWVNVNPYKVVA